MLAVSSEKPIFTAEWEEGGVLKGCFYRGCAKQLTARLRKQNLKTNIKYLKEKVAP